MYLTKHHGLGNDFLVGIVDEVPPSGAHLARSLCHRRTGVGADGLVFATPADTGADAAMTLFNADGSVAEISGNGIRCLAQALARARGTDHAELCIDTPGGRRSLSVLPGSSVDEARVVVNMGSVGEGPDMVDETLLTRPGFDILRAATGDVGNPHLVIQVADLHSPDPVIDGPALETLWKPTGINVHFLAVTGADEIALTHWERGAGATSACGTGATVAATLAHRWGLVGPEVTVVMPGGAAVVRTGEDAELIGPAVFVATVEVPEPAGDAAVGVS